VFAYEFVRMSLGPALFAPFIPRVLSQLNCGECESGGGGE
jgi:hypothetical protein